MLVDPVVFYIWILFIGVFNLATGAYWLYCIERGFRPRWFTERTKRLPLALQEIMALFLLVGGVGVTALGLFLVFSTTLGLWSKPA